MKKNKRRLVILASLLLPLGSYAQADSSKILRAFPITDYMVDLNDSIKLVQIELPETIALPLNTAGLLYGLYNSSGEEMVQKGYGKCHLVKGNYYYFSIGSNKSNKPIREGDLLYTFMDRPAGYLGRAIKLASHFIQITDVYDKAFYDRYLIFTNWNEQLEKKLLDSLVADIQFTGQYFIQHDPGQDKAITKGSYKDRKVLYVMAECQARDVLDFLDYMIARPRIYAGKKWKISEIFATWLTEGAPLVLKE